MQLLTRTAAVVTALLLSTAALTTISAPPAAAVPPPSPGAPPVEAPEGTPHSVHTFEPEALRGIQDAEGPQGAASSLARAGDIKVTLVTVKLADRTAEQTASIDLAAARAGITAASEYWKKMSNNRLSMSVDETRTTTGFSSTATSGQSYFEIMDTVTREATERLGWVAGPYKALVVFIPVSQLSYGALGAGWSGGNQGGRMLMPVPSNFTKNVVAHEFGHILGLMHADSLQCLSGASDVGPGTNGGFADTSCTIREYGDTMDLMGAAQYRLPAISSSLWYLGGFGRGDEILNVGVASGRKSYTLKAWAGDEANRAVKFTDPKSGEAYYLELRLPVGYDAGLAVGGNQGVKIVQNGGASYASSLILMPSTRPFTGYYAENHAWQAGSTFTTHAGTKVHIDYVSYAAGSPDGTAGVTVDAGSPFTDISGSGFQDDILWMYDKDLSNGWPDGSYRPFEPISREATAAFMFRLAAPAAYTAPAISPFKDVPTGHPFYREIAWMESRGLANGWDDGTFRPYESISREAMAAFLYRYSGGYCRVPASAGFQEPLASPFKDVPAGGGFYKEISWTSHAGVSTGWSDGTYRPVDPITREAMAAFIHRLDTFQGANGGCLPV
ncbi:S-layer homology domain-containing protein [Arthrobacter cavernae]|uniref:S-layer homology domain-containing protein n=1 Tax=Arthrobacter cavernae TaxID=2817681 RepID=A0A939HC83_9MICC|nr:S-layer homology domain-containing protein [Arthrobacter cavernae]MBO1268232.1 S-layer homology domain-containing protein [Arthrobacter cavernae]